MISEDLHIRNLLKQIAENDDKKAFSAFFNMYYARLVQFALLFVPTHEAEDVVSEVLIRLLRKRKDLHAIQNFKGYLFQAVKNESLNHLKSSQRDRNHVINSKSVENEKDYFWPDYIDPCEKLIEKELRQIVIEIVESLPPKRRMVYKLIKDEGMRYKEVSDLLEISERTVEEHLKIAVRELRMGVARYFEERQPLKISYSKLASSVG